MSPGFLCSVVSFCKIIIFFFFTTSYARQVARFAASICLSSIADEKFVVEVGWRAIQRHTRSELLLFYFTFTGLGERTIHPARQHASPAALRTSAR